MTMPFRQLAHADAPASLSDEALVKRLRGGEVAAGDELARRHAPTVLRYLQRTVGDDHLAEELHQQTWISVLAHLDRFDVGSGSGGFKAWLFRIATNKANDHWRWRARERTAQAGLKLVTEQDAPDAEQRLSGTEQDQKLRQALAQLPENQRQILLLRYYSGMKFTAIAEALGCPLNTALGRVHKALAKLRNLMED